uniref:Uncharacterized protein n=1 Tax=Schistocephalus solidus TaxID=70667 RepID=A0A0V0J7T0_SCHSO
MGTLDRVDLFALDVQPVCNNKDLLVTLEVTRLVESTYKSRKDGPRVLFDFSARRCILKLPVIRITAHRTIHPEFGLSTCHGSWMCFVAVNQYVTCILQSHVLRCLVSERLYCEAVHNTSRASLPTSCEVADIWL